MVLDGDGFGWGLFWMGIVLDGESTVAEKNERDADMTSDETVGRLHNSWHSLSRFTDARIGLGRAGVSQTTQHHLQFQLAHACAQDAVHRPMQWEPISESVEQLQLAHLHLKSRAQTRSHYLQRPDLGRQLDEDSQRVLAQWQSDNTRCQCVVIVADGLSSTGVELHVPQLLAQLLSTLQQAKENLSPRLICTVEQGRVAIGDAIAQALQATHTVVILGERPGLSSPDSLGLYYTYQAHSNSSDADRNCISNIRPAGLSFAEAANTLCWLMQEAEKRQLSGVQLKNESDSQQSMSSGEKRGNFLLP